MPSLTEEDKSSLAYILASFATKRTMEPMHQDTRLLNVRKLATKLEVLEDYDREVLRRQELGRARRSYIDH